VEHQWKDSDKGEVPKQICPLAILCTANPTASALAPNPRYRRQQPVNNRLSQPWQTLNT